MPPKTIASFICLFLAEFKLIIWISIICSILAGLWGPFNGILIKNIINILPKINQQNTTPLISPIALVIINFIIFNNITWRTITYIRAKFAPIIINNIISFCLSYILQQSNNFFEQNLTGKIAKQINILATGVETIITSIITNLLRGATLFCAICVTSYLVNPIFCIIILIWLIFFSGISLIMSKNIIKLADNQATANASVMGELIDTIANHHNVRNFANTNYEKLRIQPFLNTQQQTYSKTLFYSLTMHSIQGGLITMMMACCAYFLIKLYTNNLVTIGDFALIFSLSLEAGNMLWFTLAEINELHKISGACNQSLALLLQPLAIKNNTTASILQCPNGEIKFNKIIFNYNIKQPLFNNLSVTIKAGEKVGLVGYSGSGKSTFINLIMRLYDITSGEIFIDHQNIKEVTLESLNKKIAIISQDPILFQRSIADNIGYGKPQATIEAIIQAAKQAHAHEFIMKLENGYKSFVGERGIKLSGGQRQRLAIARAILKNAPILILDEATSQLDSITENLIQTSLWQLMQDKTTIIIAHRLSTLLKMDKILVFDQGKIIESGSHNNLLNQQGLYKKLWDAQIAGFLGDS